MMGFCYEVEVEVEIEVEYFNCQVEDGDEKIKRRGALVIEKEHNYV